MANKKEIKKPSAPLYKIIDDLSIYNGLYVQLKIATDQLLKTIETGDIKKINMVVDVFKIKEILNNLEPE